MTYHIDYAYTCHAGKVRPNNEDNFWCCGEHLPVSNHGTEEIRTGIRLRESLPVMAVFDGMGGESCGEMAASAAVEALGGFYEENKKTLKKEPVVFLTEACENMNEAVCRYSNEKLELLMKKSVQDAIKMTEELEKAYRGEMRLGKIFDQTFSGKEEA